MQGIVVFYDSLKGWGFLRTPAADFFVHRTAIVEGSPHRKELNQGELVSFDITDHKGRTVATNVRRVERVEPKSVSESKAQEVLPSRSQGAADETRS